MMDLINALWLKRRDIISDEYDESLAYISKIIPLKIHEIPTGTKCWTWTVPEKWSVTKAYIENMHGKRLLDLSEHPLVVVSFSLPIDAIVTKDELMEHLHTRPDNPDAIPFEFKYYEKDWGFCIQYNRLKNFNEEKYHVVIKSKFEQGTLKVGEYIVPGESTDSVVIVTHLCHPGMVNDDLAGVAVSIEIAKELSKKKNHYTYRFLFLPETIGSIAYLSQNEELIKTFKYGIFLEMLGCNNPLALQLSKENDTKLDVLSKYVMDKKGINHIVGDFRTIIGNDEFVFDYPGIDIPMVSISRASINHPFPEYHTDKDNPSIISVDRLIEAKNVTLSILEMLDGDYVPVKRYRGPLFLSGYGLWVDWKKNKHNEKVNLDNDKILFNINDYDSVFDIARKTGLDYFFVFEFLDRMFNKNLIEKKQ